MSSIYSTNLFLFVGFFVTVAGQRNMTCKKGVRSRCDTSRSKRCCGNSNVKAWLYSLSFDIYNMNIFSVTI